MEQQQPADSGPDDVLSMGEGRSPRWGVWVAVLVVLLVGLGTYRVVSGPSTPASSPAAAAEDAGEDAGGGIDDGVGVESPPDNGDVGGWDDQAATTSLRLGRDRVILTGPGIQVPHREASATALGRLRNAWLVELTSTACEDSTDVRTSYGVARASGRFTPWTTPSNTRRPVWRSPDRELVLVEDGRRLEVRRASTGKVVASYRSAARRV